MKNTALIFKQVAVRNRLMIFFMVGLTALMILFLGLLVAPADDTAWDAEGIRLGIIDRDESPLSEDFRKYFAERLGMELYEEKNYDLQADRLIDRDISAIIEIPEGFYESAAAGKLPPLTVTTLEDYENAAFIEVYANSYMRSADVLSAAAVGNAERFGALLAGGAPAGRVEVIRPAAKIEDVRETGRAVLTVDGFMMMFMAVSIFFISRMIFSDRQSGIYSRIVCSVIRPAEYLFGTNLFVVICFSAVNLIFTLCTFGMVGEIGIPLWLFFLANELFCLFLAGISVLFGLLVNNGQALSAVAIGYTTIGSMLGGFWFPIADGLGAVGELAKLFPHYWLMNLLRNYEDSSAPDVLLHLGILALFVLLSYLISAIVFTRKN